MNRPPQLSHPQPLECSRPSTEITSSRSRTWRPGLQQAARTGQASPAFCAWFPFCGYQGTRDTASFWSATAVWPYKALNMSQWNPSSPMFGSKAWNRGNSSAWRTMLPQRILTSWPAVPGNAQAAGCRVRLRARASTNIELARGLGASVTSSQRGMFAVRRSGIQIPVPLAWTKLAKGNLP